MDRRVFIGQAMLGAGAVMLPGCLFSSKPNPKGPVVGLQLYTLKDEIPKGIETLLEKVSTMGYTHIETYGYGEGKFFGKTPKEFRNILYDNGLLTPSGHYYKADYISGSLDGWKEACEAANVLEQTYIVLPYLEENIRPGGEEGYKKLAARINELGEISKAQGLQFAYHNHEFEFTYDAVAKTSLYQVLLAETNPDTVKMEMDIYWVVYAGGDPITLFYQHPNRFPLWHVKDLDPLTRKSTDIGKGSIDFKAIMKHKKESGLAFPFVEQEHFAGSPLESAAKNAEYVKKSLLA